MKDIAELLGWITVWGYGIALFNFFIKYINKKYVNTVFKDKKGFVKVYRVIMRYVVKYHKLAGIIASIALIFHFYLMYTVRGLSVSGLIAAIFIWIIFILGIYGVYIKKSVKGNWVKYHRIIGFILLILISFHIIFKRLFIV